METVYNLSQALDFFMDNPLDDCQAPDGTILTCEEDAERYFDKEDDSDIEEDEASDILGTVFSIIVAGGGLLIDLIPDSDNSLPSPDTSSTDSGLDSFGGGGDGFDGGGTSDDW